MRVLIVSDTHKKHENLITIMEKERPFDRMIHLGDAEGYEDSYFAAVAKFSAAADLDFLERAPPVGHHSGAARVADGERTIFSGRGGEHEPAEFVLVGGSADGHVRYRAQVCQVEGAMVCHAVLSDEPGPVDAEGDGQALYGHVVYDMVVGTLKETRIYSHERQHTVLGEAAGEGDGVAFGDADVENAVGHFFLQDRHRCAGRHCGGDAYDAPVGACEFCERESEYILVLERLALRALFLACTLSCGGVEFAGGVPVGRIALGGFVAFALDGAQVKQSRALHVADVAEDADNAHDVMPVERSEIPYVEALKNVLLLEKQRFEAVVEAQNRAAAALGDQMEALQGLVGRVAHLVVGGRSGEMRQI